MTDPTTLLRDFEAGRVDPGGFGHRDHLEVAFYLLEREAFFDALALYARTLQTMTAQAGAPDKYNATITVSFLGLIAERQRQPRPPGFEAFLETNPDLLDSRLLLKWYSTERLFSDPARQQFLLPDRIASTA